ncbi:MAG: phosphoribosylformylglycinamidine cyclo-ligase [Myxococcales bacterium]|nr:phosphoribosylformylglycinamidine cyclo-ligase [Myxococcales bacterium]
MTDRDKPLTYRDSGVDIDAGDALVERIKPHVRRTLRPEVIGGLGGFGGLFAVPKGYTDPVLVSGTDGVGTKLKIAFATGRHDTIGIDLVAMCVNDIAVMGAEPLFFLDYFASGRLDIAVAEAVIAGIAEGCHQAGCALIGGETAELPGMYADGEYDLAGFAVGVVERARILDGRRIAPGDQVIGLASSGLHSNGYSLARKALLEVMALPIAEVASELLAPTRIYVRALGAAAAASDLRGAAHITGGGLCENAPRILQEGLVIRLRDGSWPVPPIFDRIARGAHVALAEMRRTFNLGLGMVLVVPPGDEHACIAACEAAGERAFLVGDVIAGAGEARVDFISSDASLA